MLFGLCACVFGLKGARYQSKSDQKEAVFPSKLATMQQERVSNKRVRNSRLAAVRRTTILWTVFLSSFCR